MGTPGNLFRIHDMNLLLSESVLHSSLMINLLPIIRAAILYKLPTKLRYNIPLEITSDEMTKADVIASFNQRKTVKTLFHVMLLTRSL